MLDPISLQDVMLTNFDKYELDSLSNTLYNYDLSLMELKKKRGIPIMREREIRAVEFINIPDTTAFLEDLSLRDNYINVLTGNDSNLFSIKSENFVQNFENGRLATKGFEAILDDFTGKVPSDVTMNVGSVAFLMTQGVIDLPVGNAYIKKILKRYGKVVITRNLQGYLHISVGDLDQSKFLYVRTVRLPQGKSQT